MTSCVLAHPVPFVLPHDPVLLVGVFVTMTLLGLAATWIPARRVLKIDPARLLRE